MRRTAHGAVAAATIVAVLAVMISAGIGQPTSSHGGTPADVYMQTQPVSCIRTNADGRTGMPQDLELAATSHVLAYFSFEWNRLERGEYGLLHLELDGAYPGVGDSEFLPQGRIGTVMWSFPDIAPGAHTLSVYTAVDEFRWAGPVDLRARLENCALTVVVMPPA